MGAVIHAPDREKKLIRDVRIVLLLLENLYN